MEEMGNPYENSIPSKQYVLLSGHQLIKKLTEKSDITRFHGYTTKEILKYDHAVYSLHEGGNSAKPSKHGLLNPLEQLLGT